MPRYIIQKTPVDCAPTAILNAGKWAGKKVSYKKDYKRIVRDANNQWYGTTYKDIDRTLRKELKNLCLVRKVRNPDVLETAKHLEEGNAALISYYFKYRGKQECHIALFSGVDGTKWIGHNVTRKHVEKIPFNKAFNMFYNPYGESRVWLLSKKPSNRDPN
jgi:hypothetical protein